MVNLKERSLKEGNAQVTPISAIIKRLKRYKDYLNIPFVEKLPRILDFMLDNEFKQNIKKIYLFGSYAYGRPHKDSDLDFLIIIDDDIIKHRREVATKITLKLWDERIIPNDILVYNDDKFYGYTNPQGIENIVIKKGKLLYERG